MADKIEVTKEELDALVLASVEREKLTILINDFKDHKADVERRYAAIDKNTEAMFKMVRSIPSSITQCRDDLEDDIHSELEKHYATESSMRIMETTLNNKIEMITSRLKWTIVVIIAIGGSLQFVGTMWYMGLQISKLTGG